MFIYRKYNEIADLIPLTLKLYKIMTYYKDDCSLFVTGEYAYDLVTSRPLPRTIILKGNVSKNDLLTACRVHNISCSSHGSELYILYDEKHYIYSELKSNSVSADAMSRDFSLNTIYISVVDFEANDPLNSAEDIVKGRLRCCTSPFEVFSRQPSAILNMVRLACEQNLSIDETMTQAAKQNAYLLSNESAESIRTALFSVVMSDTAKVYENIEITSENSPVLRGLVLFRELDIFKYALPELEVGRGMEQKRKYHRYDVQEHMIHTCAETPPRLYMRLAGLFHDSGKPEAHRLNGGKNMHGHDRIGAGIAKSTLRRLHCKEDLINKVCRIIAIHMYDIAGIAKETTLRKRFAQWGYSLTQDIIDFRYSDIRGSGCEERSTKSANRFSDIFEQMQLDNTPFSIYDLKITGSEISSILDLHTGAEINEVKRELLRHCANCPEDNCSQRLIELAHSIVNMKLPENIELTEQE